MTRGTCASCRFREPDSRPEHALSGQCRRYPPLVVETVAFDGSGYNHFSQHHPWVDADHWCGEHQTVAGALLTMTARKQEADNAD